MPHDHAAFGRKVFAISETQAESVMRPNGVTYDVLEGH